jgi:hypothetical protein
LPRPSAPCSLCSLHRHRWLSPRFALHQSLNPSHRPVAHQCVAVRVMTPYGTNLRHCKSLSGYRCIGHRTSRLVSQRWSVRLLHLPFTVSLSCPYPFPSRFSTILDPPSSSSRILHIVPDRTEHRQSLPSRAIRQEFRLLFLISRHLSRRIAVAHQSSTSPLVFKLFSMRRLGKEDRESLFHLAGSVGVGDRALRDHGRPGTWLKMQGSGICKLAVL